MHTPLFRNPITQMPRSAAHTPSVGNSPPKGARSHGGGASCGSEDGQALVEFALVLPIIIVILFGIVVFGVALNDWIDETQLASEAARFASVNSEHGTGELSQAKFLAWVKAQGDNGEVQNATSELCAEHSTVGGYVRVKLSNKYKWFGLYNLLGAKAETPITSTATMRIEVPPATPYPTKFADGEPECK